MNRGATIRVTRRNHPRCIRNQPMTDRDIDSATRTAPTNEDERGGHRRLGMRAQSRPSVRGRRDASSCRHCPGLGHARTDRSGTGWWDSPGRQLRPGASGSSCPVRGCSDGCSTYGARCSSEATIARATMRSRSGRVGIEPATRPYQVWTRSGILVEPGGGLPDQ